MELFYFENINNMNSNNGAALGISWATFATQKMLPNVLPSPLRRPASVMLDSVSTTIGAAVYLNGDSN